MKVITGAGWLKDVNDNFMALAYNQPATAYFVDPGVATPGNGQSWEGAFDTMEEALETVLTGGTIFMRGDVREELVGDNLKFDITIIGVGVPHHPDLPAAGYDPGAACWRPPAVESGTTPLLEVRGRGWKFINILFDAPTDAACVLLSRNAESGEDEYDASHAQFIGCRFDGGLSGIENDGGCGFVLVEDCKFRGLTNSIKCLSTAVAIPLRWTIRDCEFIDNTNHVISSFSRAVIKRNVFGKFTTEALNTIYNTAQGEYNMVGPGNVFSGDYDTAEGYTPDTTDTWAGNYAMLTTGAASDPGAINLLPVS